ncbi:hypothetical protein BDR26DRAFT_185202 [Obelidium mucronatum]|nr:hypothetical protein BDR26DRAFT_185202 [Obelidium mucronatum]
MSIRKKHPSGEFNGYFCSNNKCDLSLNAFKIDNQPLGAAHQLMPLIQTIKKLLLNYPSEQSSSSATATAPAAVATSVDPADAGDVAVNSNTSNDTPSATENSATAAATTAASNSSNNTNMTRNRRFQIAQLIDPTPKFDYAKVFVITSTLLAAGFGANPIPFIDAPLLVATEWALLNSICSVYGLENKSTYWGLFKNIMATPMLGLMGADMMKLIPGFGTVVGGVIDVVICATLTLSLGVAVTRMCAGAMEDRNARGNGIGVGRPYFTMDAEVGAMFKEVYNGSKEAIKGMLKSGTLSKEGLMQMVSSGGAVDASADDGSETQQLEQFASEMVHGVVVAEGKKQ